MATYTAFCQDIDGGGTIWIDTVEAANVDEAQKVARQKCAADWGYEPDDVHCLGIAAGNDDILYWDDLVPF